MASWQEVMQWEMKACRKGGGSWLAATRRATTSTECRLIGIDANALRYNSACATRDELFAAVAGLQWPCWPGGGGQGGEGAVQV